jgi:hypothetical protein
MTLVFRVLEQNSDQLSWVRTMSKLALLLGTTLLLFQLTALSLAKNGNEPIDSNPPYPGDSRIVFEWEYSCSDGQGCSFTCPGSSGGSRVTKLQIFLGSVPIGNDQRTAAIFYNFSTPYFPRGNGFSISTGIGVLSCQVNGMKLEYSGPPRS